MSSVLNRLLLAAVLVGGVHTALAEDISIPLGQQGDTTLALPAPGERQMAVLERFGLADDEHPPVGKPAITRWDYREFSVYFQDGRVVDSVRHHQPRVRKEE